VSSSPGSAGRAPLLLREGIVAGLIGASTIAIWFLAVDTIRGRPLNTPTLLGTTLFRGTGAVSATENLSISLPMVLSFTLVHGLVFIAIGLAAQGLLRLAEKNANYGFGVILLSVIFLSGFLFVSLIFSAETLNALSWPAVLAGNLFALGAMSLYLRKHHPAFKMLP
jgi:hypothetical protein